MPAAITDVFYGGARGGGKTDGCLGDFLVHGDEFGDKARGIIFRRTLPELEEVGRRANELYPLLGWTYSIDKRTWTSAQGATLKLRYLDVDADAGRYQGHQYTRVYIDEAGEWPSPAPIDLMWGTLRSPDGVPCRRVITGNPGGPGHVWLKRRYVDPNPAGYARFTYQPQPELRPDLLITCVFIPARLEDNPRLMSKDPDYENRLAASGTPELFRAWRYGDWTVIAGAVFAEWEPTLHILRQFQVPRHWAWAAGLDWGYRAPGALVIFACSPDGETIAVKEDYFNAGRVKEHAGQVGYRQGLILRDFPALEYIAGDEQMWYQTGVNAPNLAEEYVGGLVRAWGGDRAAAPRLIEATHGRGSRKTKLQVMHRYFAWQANAEGKVPPWAMPRLRFTTACPTCIETIPLLPYDPRDPEDVDTRAEDHCVAPGTPVLTPRGWVPIAELVGARISRYDAEVITVRDRCGNSLVCTPDHRLLTPEGWRAAGDLRDDSEILWYSEWPRKSTEARRTISAAGTFNVTACASIVGSTRTPTAPSHADGRYITSTVIVPETLPLTWKSGYADDTRPNTGGSPHRDSAVRATATPEALVERAIAASLANSEVRRLASVTPAGRCARVYDLTVDHPLHTFIAAGGFLAHNCYDAVGAFLMSRPPLPDALPRRLDSQQHPGLTRGGTRRNPLAPREDVPMGTFAGGFRMPRANEMERDE